MKRTTIVALIMFALTACTSEKQAESTESESDFRQMTSVSNEVVIDSEPTLDDNLFKALEIVRAVCEGGFYSVSCASPSINPPMNIDRDNLVPVELMVNHAAHTEPGYVFIRCDSDVTPPPTDLIEECHRLVVAQANIGH